MKERLPRLHPLSFVLLLAAACASAPDRGGEDAPATAATTRDAEPGPAATTADAGAAQEPAADAADDVREEPAGPRLVTPEDYDRFESLRGGAFSPDGRWVSWEVRRADDHYAVHLLDLDTPDAEPLVMDWCRGITWSADSRWVAWTGSPPAEEAEKLREAGKPVPTECVLMDTRSGERMGFPEVARFAFDADGQRLALLGAEGDEGAGLLVVDLRDDDQVAAGGREVAFGGVAAFAWCDVAPLLAMHQRAGGTSGDSIQLWHAGDGTLRQLDRARASYRSLRWREDAADLAVLRGAPEEDAAEGEEEPEEAPESWTALAWRGLDRGASTPLLLDVAEAGLDGALELADGWLNWDQDGRRIALGVREREGDAEEEKDDRELPGLQVWHSKDVRIFPRQELDARRDAQAVRTAVWHLEPGTLTVVQEDPLERATLLGGWARAMERDTDPYPWGAMFGRPYQDVWIIDAASGAREMVLERVRYAWDSDGGGYLVSFDGEHYWSHDLRSGGTVNLTEGLPTDFADREYDTPTDMLPPCGRGPGGWLEEDAGVLLYDRYDVWQVALDGSGARRLTRGAEEERIHRLVSPAEDAGPRGLAEDDVLWFSTRGERSGRQGWARLLPGDPAATLLVEADAGLRGLARAEDAERFLWTAQTVDDSPDLFVADGDLAAARQVSATNAFLDDFHWTRAELLSFDSETGVPLQAALLYPADHDPSAEAPMIVYTYEKLTPRMHSFQAPSDTDYYNFTVWTQAGYFVLLPDIVYRPREPGPSALEAVRPAVAAAVATGFVDAAKVGLIGHSWGGYQAAYLPTRTDIFAASVAGAPLTDFVSFMGQIHWAGGIPETDHWETGQARMEVPYWEDREAHFRSSPLEGVQDLETPMLMMFGDDDGSVDWDQGTQFYNYARRAGKQFVLLVYEGEGHGLRQDVNRRDYHRRILEWFGHYLKGEPAPAWITEGVPYADLEAEQRRLADPAD